MARRQRVVEEHDYGDVHVAGKTFSRLSFYACGLSNDRQKRSVFEDCVFEDIRVEKCVLGSALFVRCTFKDIVAADLLTFYDAGFGACIFKGLIRMVNIGILPDDIPRLIYWQNKRLAKKHGFAIDVKEATLDDVSFFGRQIVPFVRFRLGQCLIVRSKNLYKICERLYDESTDRDFSLTLHAGAFDPRQREALLSLPPSSEHKAAEYAARLRDEGIEVIEEPLCGSQQHIGGRMSGCK